MAAPARRPKTSFLRGDESVALSVREYLWHPVELEVGPDLLITNASSFLSIKSHEDTSEAQARAAREQPPTGRRHYFRPWWMVFDSLLITHHFPNP